METEEIRSVNGRSYRILSLLGRGKGGYSYLAEREGRQVVLKQIHHEPCDYYRFGNKIEAERHDYERLSRAGIRIPRMLDLDAEQERIVKEYIEGPTVMELLRRGDSAGEYLPQVRAMAEQARAAGLNIDYYPTNFVVQDGLLYYIDYECNDYMEQWSFDSWGGTSYASYGGKNTDNVIGIANVPANSMVSWKAANAKTGSNTAVRFQYGFIPLQAVRELLVSVNRTRFTVALLQVGIAAEFTQNINPAFLCRSHTERKEVFMNAGEVARTLVKPTAGAVNQTGGVIFADMIRDFL